MTSPDPRRPFAQGRSTVPQSQPQFSTPPTPGNPRTQNRKAALIGGGVLAILLFCGGAVGLISAMSDQKAPQSAADQQSQDAAQSELRPPPASSASSQPTVEIRTVTETASIAFTEKTVNDPSMEQGTTEVRTAGVAGVRTLTYDVTYTGGVETARKLVTDVVTAKPVDQVTAVGTKAKQQQQPQPTCDPNYSGCVPVASDVDCAGGTGNGPAYVRGPIQVIGTDIYRLDTDDDGVACES